MIINFPDKRKDTISSFQELLQYIDNDAKTQGAVAYDNFAFTDGQGLDRIDRGAAEMRGTSLLSKRCKDPIEHIILSWGEDEHLTDEQALEAARSFLRKMGWGEHQTVLTVHHDTDNLHVHIGLNVVHPELGLTYRPRWKLRDSHYYAREVEIEHGFSHDNGLYIVEFDERGTKVIVPNPETNRAKKALQRATDGSISEVDNPHYQSERPRKEDPPLQGNAERMEAHTGRQSFQSFMQDSVKDTIFQIIDRKSATWQDFHKVLGEFGVTLGQSASDKGFTFSDVVNYDYRCAAGKVNRNFSKAKLEKRFGPFEATRENYCITAKLDKRYDPSEESRKVRSTEETLALQAAQQGKPMTERERRATERKNQRDEKYREYERLKAQHYKLNQKARHQELDAQRRIETERYSEFFRTRKALRSARLEGLKGDDRHVMHSLHAFETAQLKANMRAHHYEERLVIKARFSLDPFPSYRNWISTQGRNGDKVAKRIERGYRYRAGREQKHDELHPQDQLQIKHRWDFSRAEFTDFKSLKGIKADIQIDQNTRAKHVQYQRVQDGHALDVFRDQGSRIRMQSTASSDMEAALLIANEKYGRRGIKIRGSDRFKEASLRIAVKHNIKIANPELQERYSELVAENNAAAKVEFEDKMSKYAHMIGDQGLLPDSTRSASGNGGFKHKSNNPDQVSVQQKRRPSKNSGKYQSHDAQEVESGGTI